MEIKEINDKKIWDDFISENSPFSFFQSWDWGEVEKRLRKRVWRMGIYKRNSNVKAQMSKPSLTRSKKMQNSKFEIRNSKQIQNSNIKNEITGVSQIIKVKARRGDFLHVRHGPVFVDWSEKVIKTWLSWIKDLAEKEKVSFIRISPTIDIQQPSNSANRAGPLPILKKLGFRDAPTHNMDAEMCYMVDLQKSEKEILAKMRKTTRNLIRKASKTRIVVKKGLNKEYLSKFLALYQEVAKRAGFTSHRGLEEEFEVFQKENNLLILLAKYKKEFIAGAFIVFSYHQAIYHHAAASRKYKNIPASYFIQWKTIKEAKKRGCSHYNLWGVNASLDDPSHPWYGLTLFKSGFGGELTTYIHAQDLPLSNSYYLTYFAERIIKYIRGYEKFAGFRSPPWLRRLTGV